MPSGAAFVVRLTAEPLASKPVKVSSWPPMGVSPVPATPSLLMSVKMRPPSERLVGNSAKLLFSDSAFDGRTMGTLAPPLAPIRLVPVGAVTVNTVGAVAVPLAPPGAALLVPIVLTADAVEMPLTVPAGCAPSVRV